MLSPPFLFPRKNYNTIFPVYLFPRKRYTGSANVMWFPSPLYHFPYETHLLSLCVIPGPSFYKQLKFNWPINYYVFHGVNWSVKIKLLVKTGPSQNVNYQSSFNKCDKLICYFSLTNPQYLFFSPVSHSNP